MNLYVNKNAIAHGYIIPPYTEEDLANTKRKRESFDGNTLGLTASIVKEFALPVVHGWQVRLVHLVGTHDAIVDLDSYVECVELLDKLGLIQV